MEYNEFAKGAPTITEIDFARILLRYTFLHAEEYELILERYLISKFLLFSVCFKMKNKMHENLNSITTWILYTCVG